MILEDKCWKMGQFLHCNQYISCINLSIKDDDNDRDDDNDDNDCNDHNDDLHEEDEYGDHNEEEMIGVVGEGFEIIIQILGTISCLLLVVIMGEISSDLYRT